MGSVEGLELGLGDGAEEWTALGSDDSIGVGWALGGELGLLLAATEGSPDTARDGSELFVADGF